MQDNACWSQYGYCTNDEKNRIELQTVTEVEELGVYFTKDLKPSKQCITAAAKSLRPGGLLEKCTETSTGWLTDFLLIYKSYIRPHL